MKTILKKYFLVHFSVGGSFATYYYVIHNGTTPVVSSVKATLTKANMDQGTDTTSCTQSYSRMLDDDGVQDCDAGHILAHRLGGPGNQPINIFPQVRTTTSFYPEKKRLFIRSFWCILGSIHQ
jgi:hypothetical protein